MREFTIDPFVGPLPLRFGMAPSDVTSLLGRPSWAFRSPAGILIEERIGHHVNVAYSNSDKLNETVFAKGAGLLYDQQRLFETPDPILLLRKHSSAYKWLDSIVFPSIGVMCTPVIGNDTESTEWTITVAVKSHWDDYKSTFVLLSR